MVLATMEFNNKLTRVNQQVKELIQSLVNKFLNNQATLNECNSTLNGFFQGIETMHLISPNTLKQMKQEALNNFSNQVFTLL